MTRPLITLTPEMRALDAAGVLLKNKISAALVVDRAGQLVGLLAEYDCLRAVAAAEYNFDDHDLVVSVEDLMTDEIHTIGPDLDLFGIAHEFIALRVGRLPVVADGQLIGQVNRRHALRAAYELRRKTLRKRYPDYPEGREPIRSYPQRR